MQDTDRTSPKGGGDGRAAEAAGQQGLICASVTAERCPTLTTGELLVASFSGSCSFPVIQIGSVRFVP